MNLSKMFLLGSMVIGVFPFNATAQNTDLCRGGNAVHGRYYNPNYGYVAEIPKSLVGCMAGAPNPNHGIAIPLGEKRGIFVNADFDTNDPPSLDENVNLATHGEHAHHSSIAEVKFLKARALRARWIDEDGVNDMVETLLPLNHAPVLYSVQLQTDIAHEVEDLKVFDHVVASFRRAPTR